MSNKFKKKFRNIPKSETLQLNRIYQSTYDFENFLKKEKVLSKERTHKILDIGTGIGSNLQYLATQYRDSEFIGIDYLRDKIQFANEINKKDKIKFYFGNALKKNILKYKFKNFDLAISIHTICCFKNLEKPIKYICDFKANWIAINSLFYDGPLDVKIHMNDLNKSKKQNEHPNSDFNIFSLQKLKHELIKNNYKIKKIVQYFPKKKINRSSNKRGSYTINSEFDKYTVFSGPVFLPWYFILAKKKNKLNR